MIEEYAESKVGKYFWRVLSGLESIAGIGEHWSDPQTDIQKLIKDIPLRDNCHSAVLYQWQLNSNFCVRPIEIRRIDIKEGSGVLWEMKNRQSPEVK